MSEVQNETPVNESNRPVNLKNIFKFFVYSLIGIFAFFVPLTINGTSTIPLDHLVTFVQNTFPTLVPYYLLIIIALGAIHPFINRSWKKDYVTMALSFFKFWDLLLH